MSSRSQSSHTSSYLSLDRDLLLDSWTSAKGPANVLPSASPSSIKEVGILLTTESKLGAPIVIRGVVFTFPFAIVVEPGGERR
jgi:hypothetical protein